MSRIDPYLAPGGGSRFGSVATDVCSSKPRLPQKTAESTWGGSSPATVGESVGCRPFRERTLARREQAPTGARAGKQGRRSDRLDAGQPTHGDAHFWRTGGVRRRAGRDPLSFSRGLTATTSWLLMSGGSSARWQINGSSRGCFLVNAAVCVRYRGGAVLAVTGPSGLQPLGWECSSTRGARGGDCWPSRSAPPPAACCWRSSVGARG